MRRDGYRISDEPKPSSLSHLAVNPFWPFLAVMFGGAWLSWPWFVLNGFAIGSPTRRKEIAIAIAGLACLAVTVALLFGLVGRGAISASRVPYVFLALTVMKLGFTYWLHVTQAQTFEIYAFYGGVARQGFLVLLAGYFVEQAFGQKLVAVAPLIYLWLA